MPLQITVAKHMYRPHKNYFYYLLAILSWPFHLSCLYYRK